MLRFLRIQRRFNSQKKNIDLTPENKELKKIKYNVANNHRRVLFLEEEIDRLYKKSNLAVSVSIVSMFISVGAMIK